MKISRLKIRNFRNIRNIDVQLSNVVALIGENNSGKSNFLYALTLPFSSDDANMNKNLSWTDINTEAKTAYYQFILDHKDDIIAETVSFEDFMSVLPIVSVEANLFPDEDELYFVKDLCYSADTDEGILYGLRACLISSDEDGNEGESKNLSRNNEFTLTIFPKPAEFVQPAEKALYHPTTRQHNKSV